MRSATKIGVLAFLVAGLLLAVQASAIIFPCDFWCKSYKPCNTMCEEGTCGNYGCCVGNTWNCETGFSSSSASQAPVSWLPAVEGKCTSGAVSLPTGSTKPAPAPPTAPER